MGDRKVAVIIGAAWGLGKGFTEAALLKKGYKVSP
jgi:NAD(P)-dependent dehydrogenase (short-subunit alcohol dehydrogenase family)